MSLYNEFKLYLIYEFIFFEIICKWVFFNDCVINNEYVNAKVNDKVASLRSNCTNVFDNGNVFDNENVLENVFNSVNGSVAIAEQPSFVVPLLTLKVPKVSL